MIGITMTQRAIVSDPAKAGGRWHFEDTSIFIDDLKGDYVRVGDAVHGPYLMLGLSDVEVQAGLDFDLPAIADARAEILSLDIMVRCVCGIYRRPIVDHSTMNTDLCPCGRAWHISTVIESVPSALAASPERSR